jgi:CRISPR-associated endonuclease Csn1
MNSFRSSDSSAKRYVLGINLGCASCGWAAIGLNAQHQPTKLLRAGVRIFNPGVTGDIDRGKDESNAVARRAARLIRRQFRHRTARQAALFRLLQRNGLLPPYEGEEADASGQRHAILNRLDREIAVTWAERFPGETATDLPLYFLRKRALDEPLQPFELGRIFYHLSQRRGYQSNRKEKAFHLERAETGAKDEDLGQIEGEIEELKAAMEKAGARTLGEYFASLDPHRQKVRRRWTGRKMYEAEFALIWTKQAGYHPELLTKDLHDRIKYLLFYQRPLRSQAHLIGKCDLEPGERRAAWAMVEAQEFRLLQSVNNLEIVYPGQNVQFPLTTEQRWTVIHLLEKTAEATYETIRKALELPRGTQFNLQRNGEKRLKGNMTNALMATVFGDRWSVMPEEDKKLVVEEWRTIEREDSLMRRAQEHWKLDAAGAEWLAKHPAPAGYCAYSRKAICKLLPLLYEGIRGEEAKNVVYGSRLSGGAVYERIPPVREALKNLRNPAVERALTELRKVVNALVQEMGAKPYEVRIELMRSLKNSRRARFYSVQHNNELQNGREAAKARLLKECGIAQPSRADVEKALLWEECQGECPYTGRRFAFSSLFGENPSMRVSHIIPFSRIADDSFQNKVLCAAGEIQFKTNRTPFEAYGSDAAHYEEILTRVRNWKGTRYSGARSQRDKKKLVANAKIANPGKFRRFELHTAEEVEGFSNRQLTDARYASRSACELLETLYGGRDLKTDEERRQAVFASSGVLTTILRRRWGLDAILREPGASPNRLNTDESQSDYRHHAIDAMVVALSRPSFINALKKSAQAESSQPAAARSAVALQSPWKDFVDSIRPQVEEMLVSHRIDHRLSGALHEETNYGRPCENDGKMTVHIRKPVPGLSAAEIENIIDLKVREAVREKAALLDGSLKKWMPQKENEDWPMLKSKNGQEIPIKRVRIRKSLQVKTIGKKSRERHVSLGSNHHVAVFAITGDKGEEKRWSSQIVSLFEAMERKRKGEAVVQTSMQEDPHAVFKFALMKGDMLLLHKDCDHGKSLCQPSYWKVRSIWEQGTLTLVQIHDARQIKEIYAAKDWLLSSANTLRKLEAMKIEIDSLGRIHRAG